MADCRRQTELISCLKAEGHQVRLNFAEQSHAAHSSEKQMSFLILATIVIY